MWSYYDYMETPGDNSLTFGTGVLMCLFGVGEIILGSKISRSQMCYLWSEICSGPDYLGSDISSILVIQNWWWCHNFPRKVSIDFPRFKAEYKGRGEKRKWTLFCINTTENKPTTHRNTLFHSPPNIRKSVMKSTSTHQKKFLPSTPPPTG